MVDWRKALSLHLEALRFYSRLKVPVLPWESDPHAPPDFTLLPYALPLAGALLGAIGALFLAGALVSGLGSMLAAILCIGAMTLVTGAFHEDGLADMADGFGGGATRERRLEIMKDSRIGSFGASALILGFALRIAALVMLIEASGLAACAAFIAASSFSRVLGLVPLAFLPPAREAGFSAQVGQPDIRVTVQVVLLSFVLVLLLNSSSGLSISQSLAGAVMAFVPVLAITRLSHRLISGQTGDVAGACQQLSESFFLIGIIAALNVS